MKRTFLKKLLAYFSLITCATYGVIYACSDDGSWRYFWDNTNFTPETFVDKSYAPLFLSNDLFYTTEGTYAITLFNDEVVKDWTNYLGNKSNKTDIKYFLFDKSINQTNKIYQFYQDKKANSASKKWAKKLKLNDAKIKDFITFIHFSRGIEDFTTSISNSWDYEATKQPALTDVKMLQDIENKYQTSESNFLKNRYWLLTVKAYFYSNDNEKALSFFVKTAHLQPKNDLYYRAVSYVAGVLYRKKEYARANFLYSLAFDNCAKLRFNAAYNFHPQEEKDWNECLQMAKTNKQKAALWAIQGYYTDEAAAIEKIYQLDPKSQHLDYLLSRLINRRESNYGGFYETDAALIQKRKKTKDSLAVSQLNIISTIAAEKKTAKPYLWYMAAGYMQTLNENFKQATINYNLAETNMPKTNLALKQLRLLRFINNLSSMKTINSTNKKIILKDLAWLYNDLPNQKDKDFIRFQKATDWSKMQLSELYAKQNNKVMAELFYSNNNFYDNENDLQAMKNFLAKPNKTALEQIATKIYSINLTDINQYQAIIKTYSNDIPQALVFMQKSNKLQDALFFANPFNGFIKDCHDCEFSVNQKKDYSQIEFLKTIQSLQEKVLKKQDLYTNNLLLANAFYNISYFGNGRDFYSNKIMGYSNSPYDYKDKIRLLITDNQVAKNYYQKAFDFAKTDEQKAKCQYMLAKCERNEFYNKSQYSDEINFLAWNGFKVLKNNYSHTQYYQDVLAECGYFNTFVNQEK